MAINLGCLSFVTSACIFAFSISFYSSLSFDVLAVGAGLAIPMNSDLKFSEDIIPFESRHYTHIPPQSLTAILPVGPGSLNQMQEIVLPFLKPSRFMREIILVCPESIATCVRQMLQKIFVSVGTADHPDVSLRPWSGHLDPAVGVLRAISEISTDWVLLMDDQGLSKVVDSMRSLLLHPPQFPVPFGPTGVLRSTAVNATHHLGRAMYLRPPFIMPASLGNFPINTQHNAVNSWLNLGLQVSKHRIDDISGVIVSHEDLDKFSYFAVDHKPATNGNLLQWDIKKGTSTKAWPLEPPPLESSERRGMFVFFFLVLDDLRNAAQLICRMQSKDEHNIRIFVYGEYAQTKAAAGWVTGFLKMERCTLIYEVLTAGVTLSFSRAGSEVLSRWFDTFDDLPDVIVTQKELDPLIGYFLSNHEDVLRWDATLIQIPRLDLKYTEWMSSLTLVEWKNWHRPRIDINIITKDRPHSLTRLRDSLLSARYFGDHLDLRVNLEQDCDPVSLKIAEQIIWSYGHVFVHHRIIHGGLLPAVVESWFPHTNDSYGLLLEDDIELSPMYYAWIKMTILRYRYGDPRNKTPHMFGVSLYQQKHLELPLDGRQPFSPRRLFSSSGLAHPTTPYLSQIPCSWGAVYFPEQWREFHDYLTVRLSEISIAIEVDIVPGVRSNHWSKSWKKFFIELTFLRGYVMLYPNYDNFASLSTNHLEVGSHVKTRSKAKQDLFLLPLMQLPKERQNCGLLDLPHGTLPQLDQLPVLNLTGSLTLIEAIVDIGKSRRDELIGCNNSAELYDIRSLMCI